MGDKTFSYTGDILQGYKCAEIDDLSDPQYFGFLLPNGEWYIMKTDSTSGATSVRYSKGSQNFPANWSSRSGLTYDYFNNIF